MQIIFQVSYSKVKRRNSYNVEQSLSRVTSIHLLNAFAYNSRQIHKSCENSLLNYIDCIARHATSSFLGKVLNFIRNILKEKKTQVFCDLFPDRKGGENI